MTSASAIDVRNLSKTFGEVTAITDCSFQVPYGSVCGLLGPNGAGKTTIFRILLGLVRSTSGEALVAGLPFAAHSRPPLVLGATLEATGFFPGTSARSHLTIAADAIGISYSAVNSVLERVGLLEVASKPVRKMSLGMRQRLTLATALLADPPILMFDEPTNGLDPAAIAWFRSFVRAEAQRGKAVLIASHILAEMAQTVDTVVVISQGSVRANCSLEQLRAQSATRTLIRCEEIEKVAGLLVARGCPVQFTPDATRIVADGISPEEFGRLAVEWGVAVFELSSSESSLENVYFQLTGESHRVDSGVYSGGALMADDGSGSPR